MKTIKTLLLLSLFTSFIFGFILPENTEWKIVSSSLKFKISNAGFTVNGKFGDVSGTIQFDPEKKFNQLIDLSVDAKTIDTGNGTRDGHLKKKDYFNVADYPKISVKSSYFEKQSNGTFKGFFKITLKDVTKEQFIPISFTSEGESAVLKANFTINRLDYHIGESSMILSDNAQISVELKLKKS